LVGCCILMYIFKYKNKNLFGWLKWKEVQFVITDYIFKLNYWLEASKQNNVDIKEEWCGHVGNLKLWYCIKCMWDVTNVTLEKNKWKIILYHILLYA